MVILVARARFRIRVLGALPGDGCVAVARHTSYWDGVLFAILHPRVVPLTSANWRRYGLVGRFLRGYGVIWTDADSISKAASAVEGGMICWVAPRGFEPRASSGPIRAGAARIAIASGRPVSIWDVKYGSTRRGVFRRITLDVEVGPLVSSDGKTIEALSADIATALYSDDA